MLNFKLYTSFFLVSLSLINMIYNPFSLSTEAVALQDVPFSTILKRYSGNEEKVLLSSMKMNGDEEVEVPPSYSAGPRVYNTTLTKLGVEDPTFDNEQIRLIELSRQQLNLFKTTLLNDSKLYQKCKTKKICSDVDVYGRDAVSAVLQVEWNINKYKDTGKVSDIVMSKLEAQLLNIKQADRKWPGLLPEGIK